MLVFSGGSYLEIVQLFFFYSILELNISKCDPFVTNTCTCMEVLYQDEACIESLL